MDIHPWNVFNSWYCWSVYTFCLFYHISLFLVSCTKICCQHKCSLIFRTNPVVCVLFNTFVNVCLNANNNLCQWRTGKLYENSQSNQRVEVNELKEFVSDLHRIELHSWACWAWTAYVQDDCHISHSNIKDYWFHVKDIMHK